MDSFKLQFQDPVNIEKNIKCEPYEDEEIKCEIIIKKEKEIKCESINLDIKESKKPGCSKTNKSIKSQPFIKEENANNDKFTKDSFKNNKEEPGCSEISMSKESEEEETPISMKEDTYDEDDDTKINDADQFKRKVNDRPSIARYMCKPCNVELSTPKSFTKHFDKCKFGYLQKKIYTCLLCNKHFSLKNSLDSHMKLIHQSKKTFSCDLCGKEFRKQRILDFHVSTHQELQQRCGVCKRPFRKAGDLQKHMLTHQNKVPYFCIRCNQGFLEKNLYKRHNKLFHKNRYKI